MIVEVDFQWKTERRRNVEDKKLRIIRKYSEFFEKETES